MVCYISMSPLPSSTSMLCFAYTSFYFYALLFFLLCTTLLCSSSLLPFILYVSSTFLFTTPLIYSFSGSYYHLLCSCINSQKSHSLHVFITPIPLPDHPSNSSSQQLCAASQFYISSSMFCMSYFCPVLSQSSSQLCHFTGGYSLSIHHQCPLS
jgi:hypothetical protein